MSTAGAGPATTRPDPSSGTRGIDRVRATWRRRSDALTRRLDSILEAALSTSAKASERAAQVVREMLSGDPGAGGSGAAA